MAVRRFSPDLSVRLLRSLAEPFRRDEVAAKIDLNRASVEELQQVPGIGPKRAEAIVELREEKGRFESVQELNDLAGARGPITPETYKLFTV